MTPPTLSLKRLESQVAIVTGGGSGFGECMSHLFSAHGAKIVVADMNEANGRKVADDLTAAGGKAIFVRADVSVSNDVAALVHTAVERFGKLDLMVNNAGISHANQPLLNVTEEQFDRIFAVNVKSIYHSAIHCVPVFRRQGGGCFINISSTGGVRPRPGLTWYNGSKGAAILLTKSMAVELAPDKIRVNAINPAMGETALLTTFMGGEDTPENRARFTAAIPLGRLSRPADIANAALFLADPASSFVTGVCLDVDGGRCV